MNIIKKAVLFYKNEGLKNTLNRTVSKCWELVSHSPAVIKERICIGSYCEHLESRIQGKNVFVIIPCIDWYIPIFQRPHQIATRLCQRENTHVLFVSDEYRYDNFAGVKQINDNLDLVSCRIIPKLEGIFKSTLNVDVFMSWPRNASLLKYIPYNKLVYEYIDDISLFYYYTQEMIDRHYSLIREADLTVCTAKSLYEDALPVARKAILSPNAGDYDFFHTNRNCSPAAELANKVQGYDCVLGYYGCMAKWFDYDLIIEVARKKPNWCFVFACYCFDGTIEQLRSENLPNVLLYPTQPYERLPSFAACFDIQIIPFIIDDITKATSPVKLFEYMATGKPILTSRMPECLQYDCVITYNDADDFILKTQELMELEANSAYFSELDRTARENTWDARIEQILNALEETSTV